jgi:2,3-dimethylmalate lyase
MTPVNGYADVGLLTLTEMVACTAAIADSVNIPVMADGEEGFGSSRHVARARICLARPASRK